MKAISSFYKDASGATCFKQEQFALDVFGEPRRITEVISVLKDERDERIAQFPREYKAFIKSQAKEEKKSLGLGKEE